MQVWNLKAELTNTLTDLSVVRSTSYIEISQLLGTSGCSKEWPHWDWSVMGVIDTPKGKLAVSPGDRLLRVAENYIVPQPPYLKLSANTLPSELEEHKISYNQLKAMVDKIPKSGTYEFFDRIVLIVHWKNSNALSPDAIRCVDSDEIYVTNLPCFENIVTVAMLDKLVKSRAGILYHPQHFRIKK